MEKALRDCCRSIRIGKILIQSDEETHQVGLLFAITITISNLRFFTSFVGACPLRQTARRHFPAQGPPSLSDHEHGQHRGEGDEGAEEKWRQRGEHHSHQSLQYSQW